MTLEIRHYYKVPKAFINDDEMGHTSRYRMVIGREGGHPGHQVAVVPSYFYIMNLHSCILCSNW